MDQTDKRETHRQTTRPQLIEGSASRLLCKLKTFPWSLCASFVLSKSRECWQRPSTCQSQAKDVILSCILITTHCKFPPVKPCLPSCWDMFEHTRTFGLKKICLLKGWWLVTSRAHKSLSFVQMSTHEFSCKYNMLASKNATALKMCFSYSFVFAGVKRKPSTTNLRCVRERTSMSPFSNEWHLWVSAKYLIIGNSAACKDNIEWSTINVKNSGLDLFSEDNYCQTSQYMIDASINRRF